MPDTINNVTIDITSKERLEDYIENRVTRLDYTVQSSTLLEDAAHVVLNLFSSWSKDDLKLDECEDGITNKLVKCTHRGRSVLVRAYGNKSEILIDRNQEAMNLVTLSQLGLSPPLHGRFANGFVYGFIPGEVLSLADMSDSYKSKLIVQNLAVWHGINLAGDRSAQLFPVLHRWINTVPPSYVNPEVDARFKSRFKMDRLREELECLQKEMEALGSPVVFCHNDLLHDNIIYNAEIDKISFIDYEYACYNYRGFDIGNHFNEFAGLDCDYNLYPSREFQMNWLRTYLSAVCHDEPISDGLISELYREVNKFALASHFYWGIWALVQAHVSEIDFDYMSYAEKRFAEYFRRKDEFLAL